MFKLILCGCTFVFLSCQSGPIQTFKSDDREPAQANESLNNIRVCGEIVNSESNYVARDPSDYVYTLTRDCNNNYRIENIEKKSVIDLKVQSLTPQQRGVITRFKHQVVLRKHDRAANPYVCVNLKIVGEDPCISGLGTYGTEPHFQYIDLSKNNQTKEFNF